MRSCKWQRNRIYAHKRILIFDSVLLCWFYGTNIETFAANKQLIVGRGGFAN